MSKPIKIVLLLVVVLIIVGCLIVGILGLIGGGGYLFLSSKKPPVASPTVQTEPVEVSSDGSEDVHEVVEPDVVQATPVEEVQPAPTENVTEDVEPDEVALANISKVYMGTGEIELPGGVRLVYDEDGTEYKDFSEGEVYEFVQKFFKNSKWEICEDGSFRFTPGSPVSRKELSPITGTAQDIGTMIALTNFTADPSVMEKDYRLNVTGNINLDRSTPKLQLVFEYKFNADSKLNFGEKEGKRVHLLVTVMQEVTKE